MQSMRRLTTASSIFVTIVALLGTMTTAKTALAANANEDSDERRMMAQALLEQGLKAADSDPKSALGALRSSYETQPDFKVLYHVGKVCSRVKDNACAMAAYEQYLREGGTDVPAKRRKEVEKELKTLARSVGSLTIKSSVKNADVKIDGVVVGKTPLAQPVAIATGAHKIVLALDGAVEKSVTVAAGSNESVELEVAEAKKKEEPAPVVVAPPPPPSREETPAPATPAKATSDRGGFPVLPWIVTGALAAGTGVSAYFLMNANDRYSAMRDTYPITRDELERSHDSAKTLLFVTGGLGVATLVSLGVSGYLTLTRGAAPPPDADATKKIGFAVGPGGVSVIGRMP